MDLVQTPVDRLQHFDRDPGVIPQGSGQCVATRGVGWVLRWAAGIAVLWLAACLLAEFYCCLAAEHALARAARAGALEATLPRATYRSVADTVHSRLTCHAALADTLHLGVLQNGMPSRGALRVREGDAMTIALAVPARAALPGWLRALALPTGKTQIMVRAEREVPGRALQ